MVGEEQAMQSQIAPMGKIAEATERPLRWSQPRALKMKYELRASDELLGTLMFRSSFGTFATAKSGDGCWTFKRVGFWQSKVSIRLCDSDQDLAVFHNNTWSCGGTLLLPGGRRFKATTNLWLTRFEIQTEDDERLLIFRH